MDLLTPTYGLILFKAFILIGIALVAAAWITIALSRKMDSTSKLIWLLITFCVPVIGPIVLFIHASRPGREIS